MDYTCVMLSIQGGAAKFCSAGRNLDTPDLDQFHVVHYMKLFKLLWEYLAEVFSPNIHPYGIYDVHVPSLTDTDGHILQSGIEGGGNS